MSAHHLVGYGIHGLTVDNDRAAVILRRAVVVKRGLSGNINCTAIDDKVSIGIHPVCVARVHNNSQCSSVDLHSGRVCRGLIRRIYAVIRGGYIDLTVIDPDISRLQAFGPGDVKSAAVYLQQRGGVDAVIGRIDGERTARDINAAQRFVVIIFRVEAVVARGNSKAAVGNSNTVPGPDGVVCCGNLIHAGRDRQLVLTNDAVSGRRADLQAPRTVEGNIIPGVDHGVHIILVDRGEGTAVGEGTGRAIGQRDKYLVRLLHIYGGKCIGPDAHSVKHQLHLILFARVHNDTAIIQRSCENISARP